MYGLYQQGQRKLLKVRGAGHLAKLKRFSIAKIELLWRVLKFKRFHDPPGPSTFAAFACTYVLHCKVSVFIVCLELDKIKFLGGIYAS